MTDHTPTLPAPRRGARRLAGATLAAALLLAAATAAAQAPAAPDSLPAPVRVDAAPERGFASAYFVYVPPAVRADTGAAAHRHSVLVLPNNTGTMDDDPLVHERNAREIVAQYRRVAARLGVVLVMPAFPRPRTEWKVYTHALDRDALAATEPALRRLDRQLLAIVDDARDRLQRDGVRTEPRVLLHGFSAAGMFVNRFTFLHPDRVKAVSIGAPGGWPIAPVATFGGRSLPYPVGVADLRTVAGAPFDRAAVARVPMLLFVGADDTNDSVPFDDSYDAAPRALVYALFGQTPAARWPTVERLYAAALPQATVRTYPGVGHEITREMWRDVEAFLGAHAAH